MTKRESERINQIQSVLLAAGMGKKSEYVVAVAEDMSSLMIIILIFEELVDAGKGELKLKNLRWAFVE